MKKPNLQKFIADTKVVLSKHSPEILTGLGIAGMITTTVLAVKATPRALILIENKKQEEHKDKLTPVETVKTVWKCYIPATVTGMTSIACLIGSSSVNARRNAALATAYKISETALADYHEKVVETIGEKKEQVIRDKVNQKQIEKTPVTKSEIYVTGKGESLCFDPLTTRYFSCDIERIRRAENTLNKRMLHDICGTASLNEFYDEIGLARSEVGDDLGWNTEHLVSLDITPGMTDDDRPCLVIGHYNAPKWDY